MENRKSSYFISVPLINANGGFEIEVPVDSDFVRIAESTFSKSLIYVVNDWREGSLKLEKRHIKAGRETETFTFDSNRFFCRWLGSFHYSDYPSPNDSTLDSNIWHVFELSPFGDTDE